MRNGTKPNQLAETAERRPHDYQAGRSPDARKTRRSKPLSGLCDISRILGGDLFATRPKSAGIILDTPYLISGPAKESSGCHRNIPPCGVSFDFLRLPWAATS